MRFENFNPDDTKEDLGKSCFFYNTPGTGGKPTADSILKQGEIVPKSCLAEIKKIWVRKMIEDIDNRKYKNKMNKSKKKIEVNLWKVKVNVKKKIIE